MAKETGTAAAASVEAYLAACPEDMRAALVASRRVQRSGAPPSRDFQKAGAEEREQAHRSDRQASGRE